MLARLFEKRYHPSEEPPAWFNLWTSSQTAAGVDVTPDSSLQATAVFACVRCIAESSAILPLILYRRMEERGKERAVGHPLYGLLHDSPNPEMTSVEYRETLTGHLATWGNCYSNIVWSRSGYPMELWPLRPDRMTVKRENGQLRYIYRLPDGEERALRYQDVWHIRGLGSNGLVGYSPIALAMQAVGLTLAAEEFGGRFFGNGASPGGVLEHPGALSDEAHSRVRKSWEEMHRGLDNSHRVAILEEGMSYKQVGIPPDQAQFLETRKFQISEIARIFRVPPHKIADLDRATFSNIEHMSIEFVTDTLMPWLVRWEQRISLSLLTPTERNEYFAQHLVEGLLRGDTTSRYQAYQIGRQGGWLSANDIRELENLNPIDGGDVYLVPLNMVPADQVGQMDSVSTETAPADAHAGAQREQAAQIEARALEEREERSKKAARSRHRLVGAYRRIYQDTAARILRREAQDVLYQALKMLGGSRARRDFGQFSIWLDEYYQKHAQWVMRQMDPLANAYGELAAGEAAEEVGGEMPRDEIDRFVSSYVGSYAYRHVQFSEYLIRKAIQKAQADGNLDPVVELEAELNTWETQRANEIAMEETVRTNNAVAVTVYAAMGIQFIRSVAFGENCPYCSKLDGKTIGINQWMLAAGDELQPEGVDKPLTSNTNLRHAPYHGGCDCMTVSWRV